MSLKTCPGGPAISINGLAEVSVSRLEAINLGLAYFSKWSLRSANSGGLNGGVNARYVGRVVKFVYSHYFIEL